MATLDDIAELGYTVGVAHGDAQPEHERLAELEEACTPESLRGAAAEIGASAADVCRQRGMKDTDLIAAVAGVIEDAFEQFSDAAMRALEHQRRAVAIAEEMTTVYRVEGFGISVLVQEDDQEQLDALADIAAHQERVKQHTQEDDQ